MIYVRLDKSEVLGKLAPVLAEFEKRQAEFLKVRKESHPQSAIGRECRWISKQLNFAIALYRAVGMTTDSFVMLDSDGIETYRLLDPLVIGVAMDDAIDDFNNKPEPILRFVKHTGVSTGPSISDKELADKAVWFSFLVTFMFLIGVFA